jgi:hypothetical protein
MGGRFTAPSQLLPRRIVCTRTEPAERCALHSRGNRGPSGVMKGSQVVLAVNGERFAVPDHIDLSTNLADFIRTETRFKVGCRCADVLIHICGQPC